MPFTSEVPSYLRRVPSIYTFSFSPAHSLEYSPRSVISSLFNKHGVVCLTIAPVVEGYSPRFESKLVAEKCMGISNFEIRPSFFDS